MKPLQIVLCLFLLIMLVECNENNNRGFDAKTKINSYTKTLYDYEGFDYEGFDQNGFNLEGINKNGYKKDGFKRDGYDKDGYGKDGLDKDGFNKNGWNKEGLNKETKAKYDKQGFDINSIDINGNPNPNLNLSYFEDRNSDDVSDVAWNFSLLTKPGEVLVKGEFEKSNEFSKRKHDAEVEKSRLKKEYFKKIFVYNYLTNSGYDADREEWNFIVQNIESFEEKVRGTKAEIIDGEIIEVRRLWHETMVLIFSNPITIKIPIEIDKAKSSKGFLVQILYRVTNVSSEIFDFNHEKPSKYSPNDITSWKKKIFAKFLGINIWDADKKKLIYSKVANN